MATASIIIPACNESQVIGRLLGRLTAAAREDEFEILVVANGCTDDTAAAARSAAPGARVLSLAEASKSAALAAGNRAATGFPRVYVDADVSLGAGDIRTLIAGLERPGVLAAAPGLDVSADGVPRLLRWYWDVWTRLPEVRRGLFGRGVVAVSEAGYERIAGLPPVIADDLSVSLAFSPGERLVADDARVVVYPPRTFRDLIRIRVRAVTGAAQAEQALGASSPAARTRLPHLLAIARDEPALAPRVAVFLLTAVLIRWRAGHPGRAGAGPAWPRDDSSRRAAPGARTLPGVRFAGIDCDPLSEAEVIERVITASQAGQGGWISTPNIDICRQAQRDPGARALLARASLRVPDGMPLIWAARLSGQRLPERVSGSSLIFSLTAAAAAGGRSVYLLGGEPGVPESAADALSRRYAGLKIAGTSAPPPGFDRDPVRVAGVRDQLVTAAPDIVYVGLGFPKQERLIAELAPELPRTWFVACGAAIPFAAGALPRAPSWMRRSGLEWLFRLISEPRRLARRYLIDDAPYAARLLAASVFTRLRPPAPGIRPRPGGLAAIRSGNADER